VDSESFSVDKEWLATAVRDACVQTALTAYEAASMDGLCHEGAWECAVDAMRSLNVTALLTQLDKDARYG
jgi:hypothetical protein